MHTGSSSNDESTSSFVSASDVIPFSAHGVAERDEVEPAAAALAAGDGAELAAELAHALLVGPLDLGRERPRADARHVRLRDADHGRRSASGRCRSRVRAPPASVGDEVTNGYVPWSMSSSVPCAPSSSTPLAVAQRAVDEQRRVGEVRAQPPRVAPRSARRAPRARSARRRTRAAATCSSPRARPRSSGAGSSGRSRSWSADPEPVRLVGVGRADSAPRRADLKLPEPPLARLVDRQVPRHDHVRVARRAARARSRARAPRARRAPR